MNEKKELQFALLVITILSLVLMGLIIWQNEKYLSLQKENRKHQENYARIMKSFLEEEYISPYDCECFWDSSNGDCQGE